MQVQQRDQCPSQARELIVDRVQDVQLVVGHLTDEGDELVAEIVPPSFVRPLG